ncbi:MAG: PqqD family protein [Pseudomonadota bacterium]
MTTTPLIKRTADVVFQNLDGEDGAVLLHLGSGQYHSLNPVGARIWEILEKPMSEEQLTRQIVAEFEASDDMVAQDVTSFLKELVDRKLVEVSAEG